MKKIITLLAFVCAEKIQSQIVFTDINPDVSTTITSGGSASNIKGIDFNNDGTPEFNFRWDDFGNNKEWFMHMTYSNNNQFVLKGSTTNPYGGRYIQSLSNGNSISSTSNWGNSSPEPFIGDNTDPNFQNLGDRYVGVKFQLNSNTHYGWVLVNFSNKTLTIKEYAYNSTPNTSIKAGEKSTVSVNEINNDEFSFNVYPNPATTYFTLEHCEQAAFTILDMNGKTIKNGIINSDCKVMLSELTSGNYFLLLTDNTGHLYRKFFVKE